MKKIIFILCTALFLLNYSCAKFEGTVDTTNKDLGYLDNQVFYELEENFQVELPVANISSVKVSLFLVEYDENDAMVFTRIKDFGEKPVVEDYVSFAIPKIDFGTLDANESLFVLRAEGGGVMRESYIKYISIFPKSLTYGKSYKGVENKSLEDTAIITLNKKVDNLTWTAERKVNSSGIFSSLILNDVTDKPHQKKIFYKLSDIEGAPVVGEKDTIIYRFTAKVGTTTITKQYKEPVKVDLLANTVKFDLTFTDNCFTSALTSATAPSGIDDDKKTLYSIIEGKLLRYSELKKDSLPCLALSGTPTSFNVAGLTNLTSVGSISFVEITSDGATIFKNGSRVSAESFTTSISSIDINVKGTKYYAVKLVKKGTTKDDIYKGDDVYFGLLEVITAYVGSSPSFDKVSLTLKYGLKRDYTKE